MRSAEQSGQADQLADSVARADLATLDPRPERGGWSLDLTQFVELGAAAAEKCTALLA